MHVSLLIINVHIAQFSSSVIAKANFCIILHFDIKTWRKRLLNNIRENSVVEPWEAISHAVALEQISMCGTKISVVLKKENVTTDKVTNCRERITYQVC